VREMVRRMRSEKTVKQPGERVTKPGRLGMLLSRRPGGTRPERWKLLLG